MQENCPITITPYAQPGIINSPPIFNLNYTNQDFWSWKARLVDFINARFGPAGTEIPNTFNDFVEGSLAIMLMEIWAFVADTLSFKQDQIVNELGIDTVTQIDNMFRLAKLVGFQPQPPIASRSLWSATINQTYLEDITIPTPIRIDVVANDTPITIELFQADANNTPLFGESIVIPAGKTQNISIVGLEGLTYNDEDVGTGEISQVFQLEGSPVLYDSITVIVDGVQWTQVDYFTDSQPRREFRVEFDSSYNGYVIFGNNRAGMIPSKGSQIEISYRVGGGIVGNIVTGFVNLQKQAFVDSLQFSVPINFRNYTKGEYGYDGDTIEDVRSKLPAYLRTQSRCVTGLDYKTTADQFATPYYGQIGKATAALRNHGCAGNIVDLFVLAKDSGNNLVKASNQLKMSLNEEMLQTKMLTDFLCIRDGGIVKVDVTIDVTLSKTYKKLEQQFRAQISSLVNQFFSLSNWDYGQSLKNSDIVKQLSSINELETIDIAFVTDTEHSTDAVSVKYYEIIRPDVITISFNYN